jgi:hypothetical protein
MALARFRLGSARYGQEILDALTARAVGGAARWPR